MKNLFAEDKIKIAFVDLLQLQEIEQLMGAFSLLSMMREMNSRLIFGVGKQEYVKHLQKMINEYHLENVFLHLATRKYYIMSFRITI